MKKLFSSLDSLKVFMQSDNFIFLKALKLANWMGLLIE